VPLPWRCRVVDARLAVCSGSPWASVYEGCPSPAQSVTRTGPITVWERCALFPVALLPDRQDKWWTVDIRASMESVKVEVLEEVLDGIRTYALPAIEQQVAQEAREG
jgi:hypothetical protein